MNLFLVTLGCDKNRVDAEEMLTSLTKNGFSFVSDEYKADVIVVNTCCFIDSAKEESIETILEMAKYKIDGNCKYLIVTGCLAQRYQKEIIDEIKEVDAVVGTTAFDALSETIKSLDRINEKPCIIHSNIREFDRCVDRILTTPIHYAYLKIAEGCSKCCSYCIIPQIRGTYRSFEMENLLLQAGSMASRGVRELIIIAQETTIYGVDLYGKKSLHILLKKLAKIDGIDRIRLLYSYPEEIYDELMDIFIEEPKICHYIDMPIQHCNDEILKKMGRRINKEGIINIINKLREKIPDIVIRTSLITGFPGETKAQHDELLQFLKEMKIDHVGVFTYSKEEQTKAAKMNNQIQEDIKIKRREELMLVQKDVIRVLNKKWINKELLLLVDGYLYDADVYIGRSYADAPDVDSLIFFKAKSELNSGSMVKVKIKEFNDYDFYGYEMEE